MIGLVLFAVGLVIGGLAPSMPVLVIGRFVQGFGAGVVPAIGYVAIGRAFSVAERPRMFAILSTAWVVPGLVGPVLAERIAQGVGWRWVFLGLLPLVLAAGLLVVPAMMRIGPVADRDPVDVPFRRRRLVEAVRVAIGTAIVVAGLDLRSRAAGAGGRRRSRDRSRIVAAADASRDAASGARPSGGDRIEGCDHVRVLRSRCVRAVRVDEWTWQLDAGGERRGDGHHGQLDGRRVDPATLHRSDRRGVVHSSRATSLLAPGVALAAVAALLDGLPVWLIHVGGLAAGLGMGFAYSAHAQLTFRSVDERDVGSATSSLQLSDNLGVALGTGVVGAVVAFGDDVGWAAGAAVAIAWVVPDRRLR